MMTLKTLAGKLLMFALSMENWIVIIAGIAGVISWSFGELMLGGPSKSLESFLVSFIRFFRLVTITFLIFGGLAWFISWTKTRILSLSVGAQAKNYQPWFYLVILILSVEGGLAAVVVHPLPLLVQENIGLLQSWGAWEGLRRGGEFSGIYFVPVFGILLAPALGVMTALAFIAGAAASLGYLLMGLEGSPRVLLRSICLQISHDTAILHDVGSWGHRSQMVTPD